MVGAIIIAVALVAVIPVAVLLTSAVVAAVLGWSLVNDGEAENAGSELIQYNV